MLPLTDERARKLFPLLLLAFSLVQMAAVFVIAEIGPLSVDESLYHRMTQSLAQGHGLFLWNGYEELPSRELTHMFVYGDGAHITAQYPYGFPMLAWPAYALLGYRGLFFVSALALIGVVALTYRIGRRLFDDAAVGLIAAALLVLATFAWEHGLAAWPHMSALLFSLAGFDSALTALRAESGTRRACAFAALAGLAFAASTTLRHDGLAGAVAIAGLLLLAVPVRRKELLALGAGLLPGLGFSAVINGLRWGNWNPLRYAPSSSLWSAVVPVVIVGVALVAGAGAVTRPAMRARLAANRRAAVALALVGVAALIAGHRAILNFWHGLASLVVDMRWLPESAEPAGIRTESGAVWQWFATKKALLQSCPYLPLLILPALRAPRAERRLLLVIPLIIIPFFAARAWHGGLCIHIRYFLPALPFLTIGIAYAVRALAAAADRRWLPAAAIAAVATVASYEFYKPETGFQRAWEQLLLTVPLVMAAITLVVSALFLWRPQRWIATAALVCAASGAAWAGVVAFRYDYAWSRGLRQTYSSQTVQAARLLTDDSLVFVDRPDHFYGLSEYLPKIRIAIGERDGYQTAWQLIGFHRGRGRRVFGILLLDSWKALGLLPPPDAPQVGPFIVYEIQSPTRPPDP